MAVKRVRHGAKTERTQPSSLCLNIVVAARPVLEREPVRRQERRVELPLRRVLEQARHVLLPVLLGRCGP